MSSSYPYLDIARRYGVDYGLVLAYSEVAEFGLKLTSSELQQRSCFLPLEIRNAVRDVINERNHAPLRI